MQWFRVYTEIIDDPKVAKMDAETFKFFIFLMALACEQEKEGYIEMTLDEISWRLRCNVSETLQNVSLLVSCNILTKISDNKYMFLNWEKRQYKSDNSSERVRKHRTVMKRFCNGLEQNRTEQNRAMERFNQFYTAYPNKKAKSEALKAWNKLNGTLPDIEVLLSAIEKQKAWRASAKAGEFRPEWKHPSTWLNKGCWADEVENQEVKASW